MKFFPLCLLSLLIACDSSQKTAVSDSPTSLALSNSSNNSSGTNDGRSEGRPVCTRDAVNHRDGWGWENGESCLWPGAAPVAAARTTPPECTREAVNHGSGWGFENGESCRWGDSTLSANNATAAASSSGGSSGTSNIVVGRTGNDAQCSPSALDTGDGWGWEYGAPCQWGTVRPNPSAGDVYVPGPVRVPVQGYIDGKPICLTDASDGNGDGFGYEYNRTCAVVEGRTANADRPLLNARWCQPWAEISYGDYVLQNNTWNDSEVYSDDWHQCIELTGNQSNYIAKWDYNWLDKNRGNEFSVKSYPQVYYGRKTRDSISGSVEKLGLPASINRLPDFKVKYKYSETGNPERNVALESFFHTSCEAEEWNKQFEMMVWVGVPVTRGPGPKVAEVTIDGVGWNVHVNPQLDWGYVAFVAQRPRQEGWLDWNKFVEWTRYNGPAYGVPRIQNNTCMGAIEIGTETFWGRGTFTLHEFDVVKN